MTQIPSTGFAPAQNWPLGTMPAVDRKQLAWRLLAGLVLLAGAAPLLVATPAPLQDWPSHLARVWITRQVQGGDPFWGAHYELQGFLIPNAILDIGVLGLSWLGFGHDQAGMAFLLLVYAAFTGGFCALARQADAASRLTPALAAACFYSASLFYGLVNFVAGLAVMLWALAFWVRLAARPGRRAALAVGAVILIAPCHIIAAFVFVGIGFCLDAGAWFRAPARRLASLLPACAGLAAAIGLLALSPVAGDRLGQAGYNVDGSLMGFLSRKALITAHGMMSGRPGPDLLLLAAGAVLLVAVVRLRPRLALPWALATGAVAALTLAAPDTVGEGAFFDARLAPIPVLLAAATLPLRSIMPRLALLAGALLVARTALLAVEWREAGQTYALLDAELARLAPGSTLLAGLGSPPERFTWADEWTPPSGNIISLAVPHGIFVPSVFASPVQQPLALRPPWRGLRHYMDMSTPAKRDEAAAMARDECRRGRVVNVLVVHLGARDGDARSAGALPGPLGDRFSLISACGTR